MKKRIYKLFLIFLVCLSLGSGSPAQNEVRKMLEALSKASAAQAQEEDESEEEHEFSTQAK